MKRDKSILETSEWEGYILEFVLIKHVEISILPGIDFLRLWQAITRHLYASLN